MAERTRAVGLQYATEQELTAALFAEGFSTRERVNEVSGRGVGMAALLEAAQSLGGGVELRSERGVGTTLRVSVPSRSRFSLPPVGFHLS